MVSGSSGVGVAADDLVDLGLHRLDERRCLGLVTGRGAEFLDLAERVVDRDRCRPVPPADVEFVELRSETVEVATDQHQVGFVGGDRLDVVVERRQVVRERLRLLRIVGELVDGDQQVAGTDGEHHLGVRRTQRDDPLDANADVVDRVTGRRIGRSRLVDGRRGRHVGRIGTRWVIGTAGCSKQREPGNGAEQSSAESAGVGVHGMPPMEWRTSWVLVGISRPASRPLPRG